MTPLQRTKRRRTASAGTLAEPLTPLSTPPRPAVQFVRTVETNDQEQAIRQIKQAQAERRPLLLRGLLRDECSGFTIEDIRQCPGELKIWSDDALLGAHPIRDWISLPERYLKAEARCPKAWGGIGTIMTAKPRQRRMFESVFMGPALEELRRRSGYTAVRALGDRVYDRPPSSENVFFTGAYAPGRHTLKSDAHQDMYDNLMLCVTGRKIWALAELPAKEVRGGSAGRLKDSLGLDAVERSKNRTETDLALAEKFDCVEMLAGDVLFNPRLVWHQVNSDPETLAYSVMYLDEDGDGGEEDGQVAGLGEVKRNLAVEEWDTEAR